MRILNVRFKNLNSLFGEWKIDFTNPAYTSDGIFAITGPTGAGKTTILDAICLALYGRTPRLKDVNSSTNELMSRHTGECFSEIVFETGSENSRNELKKYSVFWGQHRARKNPQGALQPPRHEIADAETGEILETRQRDTAEKIKEVTGLTFDQFVRSILLAQGSFSAFLQSEPGERSPILEQITGTEIYSQISIRVHEIRNAERSALSALEAEISGFRTLEPQEKEELESQLEAQIREEAESAQILEQYSAQFDWLENMAALQKELDALEDRRQDLIRRQEGFEPERQRLERAQQALEFGSAHAALDMLRKEQEAEKRTLFDCQAKLPELEADVRRSEEALQLARSVYSERQVEQKNVLDLARKIRELDLKEKEKEAPILDVQAAIKELTKTTGELRAQLNQDQSRFETMQIRARDVRKFLQDNAADERLIEQLAGIRTRFDTLCAVIEKRRSLDKERAAAETRRQEAQNRLSGQSILYETAKVKFASGENALRKQRDALDEILGTRTIAEWHETLEEWIQRKMKQGQIEEALKRRAETMEARTKLEMRLAALESSRKECQQSLAEQKIKIQNTEKEVQYLEIQAELVQRIQDLEEARGRLQDGEPCPLCGSMEHPYASGNIPQADEVQLALRRVKDEWTKDNETFSVLRIKDAQLIQETFQAQEETKRLLSQLQDIENQLAEGLAALQLVLPMNANPLTALMQQQQKTEENLQKTRGIIERAEKMEKKYNWTREELERSREERDQLARSQQEAEFVKETATHEWERLTQEVRFQDEELKNIRLDLIHHVAPFGFKNLPDEEPKEVLASLEARSQRWQERRQSRIELEKELSVRERDLHHMKTQLDKLHLELKEKTDIEKKLRAEKDTFRQQRVSLFGEKDPDAEEASQVALVEAARQQVEAKREEREVVLQEFSNMHSRMEALAKSLHVRSDNLQKAEFSFKKQLMANDFRNEDAYLAARLTEAERKALQERAQSLSVEQVELDARLMDKKFGLEELRRRNLTDNSLDEIRERKDQFSVQVKELQQSIGALRSRLKNEEDFALKKRERMAVIEKQRREYHRWERLHDLIGSADGQKYRNFAQSLTFEMVLRHANQQLQKMMDRYFLIGDEEQTLGLKVVDNDQAAEIRSSKNLSGGESFIVSLALALGLSQMASQKVRVDSLFLDEGFGTLDEEALDTALSTLTGLRQEGKLIGVISHVEALKERIGTQIEVISQGNGRSIIRAPGCVGPDYAS